MKKFTLLLACASLLTACGNGPTDSTPVSPNPSAPSQESPLRNLTGLVHIVSGSSGTLKIVPWTFGEREVPLSAGTGKAEEEVIVARGKVSAAGELALQLPTTVSVSTSMDEFFSTPKSTDYVKYSCVHNVTLLNTAAKVGLFEMNLKDLNREVGFVGDSRILGTSRLNISNNMHDEFMLIYASEASKISGSRVCTATYLSPLFQVVTNMNLNVSFQKGWNFLKLIPRSDSTSNNVRTTLVDVSTTTTMPTWYKRLN